MLRLTGYGMPHLKAKASGQLAFKIAGTYAIGGLIWIALSDLIARYLSTDIVSHSLFQIVKGSGFVLATTVLLYLGLRKLFATLAHTQEMLESTELEVVERLGRAAEYRDDDTGWHIMRMSRYCGVIAAKAGLSKVECEMILRASKMHDIGKIGIPDDILLKPGKLTLSERQIIEQHTVIGANLLSGGRSPLVRLAETIALTHHERWDGSGYPHQLKGYDIPLEGRISAIADVFDALTSRRLYKEPWDTEDAIKEILAQSGKQFDPDLVECFMAGIEEIIKIKDEFSDPVPVQSRYDVA